MTRVLLIEDDPETATEILTELGGKGYAVGACGDTARPDWRARAARRGTC